jgi:hypothetical protein
MRLKHNIFKHITKDPGETEGASRPNETVRHTSDTPRETLDHHAFTGSRSHLIAGVRFSHPLHEGESDP